MTSRNRRIALTDAGMPLYRQGAKGNPDKRRFD